MKAKKVIISIDTAEDGTVSKLIHFKDDDGFLVQEELEIYDSDEKNLQCAILLRKVSKTEYQGNGIYLQHIDLYNEEKEIYDTVTSLVHEDGEELREVSISKILSEDGKTLELVNIVNAENIIIVQEERLIDKNNKILESKTKQILDNVVFNEDNTITEYLDHLDIKGEPTGEQSMIIIEVTPPGNLSPAPNEIIVSGQNDIKIGYNSDDQL
jgi:hypothetical protein